MKNVRRGWGARARQEGEAKPELTQCQKLYISIPPPSVPSGKGGPQKPTPLPAFLKSKLVLVPKSCDLPS